MFKKSLQSLFCSLHPACVFLSVCSLHFKLSLHFTPGPQSEVYSPLSAFYTDRFFGRSNVFARKSAMLPKRGGNGGSQRERGGGLAPSHLT